MRSPKPDGAVGAGPCPEGGTARPEGAMDKCGRSRAVPGGRDGPARGSHGQVRSEPGRARRAGRPGPREPWTSADGAGPCPEGGTARPEGAMDKCGRSRAVPGGRDGPARGSHGQVRTEPGRARRAGRPGPREPWTSTGRTRVDACPARPLIRRSSGAYCFRLTRSWSIWSEVVMTLAFAWKPRWATISSVNSWARSTLLISSVPDDSVPRPPEPAVPTWGRPESLDWRYMESPAFSRPAGLVKLASAICPRAWLRPFENTPVTTPSFEIENDCSEPIAEPSCDSAAKLFEPANWTSASGAPAVPTPIATGAVKFVPIAAFIAAVNVIGGSAMFAFFGMPVFGSNTSDGSVP